MKITNLSSVMQLRRLGYFNLIYILFVPTTSHYGNYEDMKYNNRWRRHCKINYKNSY